MGAIKSAAKRTRQYRLASINQQLLDKLNSVEREAGKYEKALLEYAKESNWCTSPPDEVDIGVGTLKRPQVTEWIGPGNGPSLAQACLKQYVIQDLMPKNDPDSGKAKEEKHGD